MKCARSDSMQVRRRLPIEFVEGGCSHSYPWIPRQEIWAEHTLARPAEGFVAISRRLTRWRAAAGTSARSAGGPR